MSRFQKYVFRVGIAHVVLLALLLCSTWILSFLRPRPQLVIPFDIVMEQPFEEPEPEPEIPEPVPPPPPVKPEPLKEVVSTNRVVVPPKEVVPPPPKQPRPTVEVSKLLVRKTHEGPKPLSAKEIQDRLLSGLPTQASRSGPVSASEDQRGLSLIYSVYYRSWTQPSREEVGGATATAEITLDGRGKVVAERLLRPSGNAVLDGSVLQALKGVEHITGLTPAFLGTSRKVSIEFKVE